jgi:predicted ATPase/DNA-binding CsgD family transcriptional regulator
MLARTGRGVDVQASELFGTLLQRYRVAAGYSPEALAERASLSRRGIADLERGARRTAFPATIRRLAEALELDAQQRAALLAAARPGRAEPAVQPLPVAASLPVATTSFVGRQRELEDVGRLLQVSRLLTLTGAGGSGKTRLALEAARGEVMNRADGVAFVPLAAIADFGLVARNIAQALGVREIVDQPIRDTLVAYLRSREAFLLLDNFEHLLPSAPLIGDLLESCPRLKVLVTSRELLRLRGEHEYRVPPLAVPSAAPDTPVAALLRCASVVPFSHRAAQVSPEFTLTAERARLVGDVCLRLDGLPLAIELAAARTRVLSLKLLLERLDHRLPVLVGGPRDLPARQQTLRDTIAWSHGLLSAGEQRLFRRLAVFAGGCTLPQAEALCRSDPDLDQAVLDGLSSLVIKNLMQREEQPDGSTRFSMLETIREFAFEELAQNGELEAVRERHAYVFAALAATLEPHLYGRERMHIFEGLRKDQENIRAALRWSVEQQRAEPGLVILGALWLWFWPLFREGRAWAEAVLRLPAEGALDRLRSKALFMASLMAWAEGDGPAYEAFANEAEALARAVESPELLAYALTSMRVHGPDLRNRVHARFAECLDAARASNSAWLMAWASFCYAMTAQTPDPEAAARLGREAVDRFRALGDDWLMADASVALGLALLQLGQFDEADRTLREGLPVLRLVRDRKWIDTSLLALGVIAEARGDVAAMAELYAEALVLCRDTGDDGNLSLAFQGLAATAALRRDWPAAARLLGATHTARQTRMPYSSIRGHEKSYSATMLKVRGELGEGAFQAAWEIGTRLSSDEAIAEALVVAADYSSTVGGGAARPANLSDREEQVLHLLANACTSREIAAVLGLSIHTVRRHIINLYAKIGAHRRSDAVAYALRHGLIDTVLN